MLWVLDNPESGWSPPLTENRSLRCPRVDIAGANNAGWNSVLVRTGVYEPDNGPPTHTPTYEATDVEEAVLWAINNELGKRTAIEETQA